MVYMPKTSDQILKAAAAFVSENREKLVDEWASTTRKKVDSASDSSRHELLNHVSELMQDLHKALAEMEDFASARDASTSHFESQWSEDHGVNRARQAGYSAAEIVHEYALLRHVVTDNLQKAGLNNFQCIEVINSMFELAAINAVSAFAEAQERSREKIISTLVHDLRSPISAGAAALDLLEKNFNNKELVTELLPMAKRSSNRGLNIISSLLDEFSVTSTTGLTLNFLEADLASALKKPLEDLTHIYPSKLKLNLPTAALPGVYAVDMIIRVLDNLVSNAFKYGSKRDPILVIVEDAGETAQISVNNQGNPIPKEKQERMFRMFQSFDQRQNHAEDVGWGLGLTHVELVAHAHGGEVKLQSNLQEGTTFTLVLKKECREPGFARIEMETQNSSN